MSTSKTTLFEEDARRLAALAIIDHGFVPYTEKGCALATGIAQEALNAADPERWDQWVVTVSLPNPMTSDAVAARSVNITLRRGT